MIHHGDCLTVLPTLPAGAADACFTSPPYYGLRDYGVPPTDWPEMTYAPMPGLPEVTIPAMTCALGLEPTPEAYVGHLILIFREVYRVLPSTGALLLNLGDSYATGSKSGDHEAYGSGVKQGEKLDALRRSPKPAKGGAIPKKNLLGIPWRVAFALQGDGWYLRQDIVWHKPNPMPESVKDRCTKAHEYVFLLSKKAAGYYWDAESIAEPITQSSVARLSQNVEEQAGSERAVGKTNGAMKAVSSRGVMREMRRRQEVIGAKKLDSRYGEAAPEGSRRPGVLAALAGRTPGNTSHKLTRAVEAGDDKHQYAAGLVKYADQRAQLVRALELAEEHGLTEEHLDALRAVGLSDRRGGLQDGAGKNRPDVQALADEARAVLGSYATEFLSGLTRNPRTVWTIPTTPFKDAHFAVMAPALAERGVLAITPPGGTVLDPFLGSGTTGRAALKLGREFIGVELLPGNVTLSRRRTRDAQPGLALFGLEVGA